MISVQAIIETLEARVAARDPLSLDETASLAVALCEASRITTSRGRVLKLVPASPTAGRSAVL